MKTGDLLFSGNAGKTKDSPRLEKIIKWFYFHQFCIAIEMRKYNKVSLYLR